MTKVEDVKYLSLDKRHAILTCLALIVKADEEITEKENEEIIFQVMHILDMSPNEIRKGMMSPSELRGVLDTMSGDELGIMGLLMGRVAGSDGKIDNREVNSIKSILKVARLNPEHIQVIIDAIKVR
jgi:uncharacterized tellurite resistance protein B-like protein